MKIYGLEKMTQSTYDVAVIGAGPAGSIAAKVIAESGLSVLLVDRRKEFGLPVQCGEFLPSPFEISDLLPSSKRVAKLVNIPKKFIVNRTNTLHLYSPGGRIFPFPLDANVVNRSKFDRDLIDQAESAGAEIISNTRLVTTKSQTELHLKEGTKGIKIHAKVVVGADGANSQVAKSLGSGFQHRSEDLCPSVQFVMRGGNFNPDAAEMYFGREVAPGGYFWIIPRNESEANVGLGIRYKFADDNMSVTKFLSRLIKSHPQISRQCKGAEIVQRIGAIIPMGGPIRRTFSERTLLVGDAAGHVMASNGGGIPTALAGGEIAGQTIVSHLQGNTSLADYERIWRNEFESELQSALNILRIADQVMVSDSLTDLCMSLAGPRFLKHIIRCRLPVPVDLASKTFVRVLQYIL